MSRSEPQTEKRLSELRESAERFFREGHYQRVLEVGDEALEQDSDDRTILRLKADSLKALSRWSEAAVYYSLLQDQPQQALDCYTKAVHAEPSDSRNHVGRGDALLELGRYSEAIVEFETAQTLRPKDFQTSQWLSRASRLVELEAHNPNRSAEIRQLALQCYNRAIDTSSRPYDNLEPTSNAPTAERDLAWALNGKGS